MKPTDYIRCPRCELNFIQRKDKYCSVCQAEMNADPNAFDELEMETCPICKTNFIRADEIMCGQCAKERALNGDNSINIDDDWETYVEGEEEASSIEEETGDMASVTDLDGDDLEDLDAEDIPEIDEEFDMDDEEEEQEDEDDDFDEDEDDDFDDDEDDDF